MLPWYANTHTESSGTGRQTSRLREEARQIIHDAVGGTDRATWSSSAAPGATAAINKLVGILELRCRPGWTAVRAAGGSRRRRPVVFVGPYEHHSNELPWRESIADVVAIGEDADGHIDLAELRGAAGPLRRTGRC